jgi:N-acyl-D-amino-acid deacylase
MSTILLHGGTVVDGSGGEPFAADVLVAQDRIAAIGADLRPADVNRIDCSGLVIAPGFIDAHSHSDLQVLENRPEKLLQGATSEVVGNCGFSPYPAWANVGELREFANGILHGGDHWGWPDAQTYLRDVSSRCRTGVLSLVGHGSLRIAHAGHRLGPLSQDDLGAMERSLDDLLGQGASGFSSGLMYSPGASAPVTELDALCRVVARRGLIYATHMRDYGDSLGEAVSEQVGIARRTGCRLQISHLQAVGPRNWPKQEAAIEAIEDAHRDGVDVAFDCYPYTRGSTVLTQLLPQSALDGGMNALLGRLSDANQRHHIAVQMDRSLAQGWAGILISALPSAKNRDLIGRSIAEIAQLRHAEPATVALDLLVEEKGAVNMLEINQSDENLRRALTHPLSIIITDGFYVDGLPHPRLYGSFPFLLGELCRKRKWLTLPEAVSKITSRPAQRFGLRQRGLLKRGYYADITVFNPAEVNSPATYENPAESPIGIRYVLREGRMLVENGNLT